VTAAALSEQRPIGVEPVLGAIVARPARGHGDIADVEIARDAGGDADLIA